MKKKITALFMSTALLLSFSAVASADSTSAEISDSQNVVKITNLGPNANDNLSIFRNSINLESSESAISPMSTDGRNIQYSFTGVSSYIYSSSPLPLSTYGTVPLTVVQYTNFTSVEASVTYQFTTKDGSKKSSIFQIDGNLRGKNKTITFTDVPQGTASNPVYLLIVNKCSEKIDGNGYTSF